MEIEDNHSGSPMPDMSLSPGLGTLSETPISQIEEEEIEIITEPPSLDTQYQTEFFKVQGFVRSDTPETLMTEFTNRPDITIRCDRCAIHIDLIALREHRAYHSALSVLKYKGNSTPHSNEALLRRRNMVIKQLLKQASATDVPFEPKQVQVINDAYEIIKSNLEDTFEEYRAVREPVNTKVQGVALSCSPQCVDAIGICASPNERWKGSMEDTRVYQDCFGDDKNKCYVGLFDGHHGRFAAEVAASTLHYLLLNEMAKFDSETNPTRILEDATDICGYEFKYPDSKERELSNFVEGVNIVQQIINLCEEKYEKMIQRIENSSSRTLKGKKKTKAPKHPLQPKIAEAFKKVYEFLDILLSYGKDECSKVRWSGCSALTAIIQNTDEGDNSNQCMEEGTNLYEDPIQLGLIHIANAGNVHGVLVRGNHGYQLTKDHTPNNEKEKSRVIQAGGTISESSRDCQVNGILATTRGLGNHGDVSLKKCIVVEPHTLCVPIDQYAQFLVLASHGVWEVFNVQEVTSLLLKLLPSHQIPAPRKMCESIKPLLNPPGQSELGDRRTSFASTDLTPKSDTDETRTTLSQDTERSRSVSVQENVTPVENLDSGRSENISGRSEDMLTIEADLKTEVGSHVGDDDVQLSADGDHVSIPVHSDLSSDKEKTQEEIRRDLARSMAEHLIQASLLAGSRDNITVMVMMFPGCGV
ncbi:protein phosphatase 2C-like domain-containing protein 1 isoform X2 [Gigantopelta aegis]|uniref:protein phosphatase 2C-like domain-containing protein 1 isoform X2 n=1 Tax=Gigantopelta aegis TaxID=1735272 RepID=UPI001B88BF05|nr:protein phosphatase 2C-like domain-containing protein 1 isoform X2 [Gigantopelta aegis]